MDNEILYLSHDNTIDLILKKEDANGDQTALTNDEMDAITQITATFGTTKISTLAANKDTGPIRWRQTGYDPGEIRLVLGGETITADLYPKVPIIVYDADNTDGVVWALIPISVKAEVEGT